jgi:hypothetical protein
MLQINKIKALLAFSKYYKEMDLDLKKILLISRDQLTWRKAIKILINSLNSLSLLDKGSIRQRIR